MVRTVFWIFLSAILYTYVGYTSFLWIISQVRRIFRRMEIHEPSGFEPDVTLLIPAFNEADYIIGKVKNSFELDYPREKLRIVWVTDGSTDRTAELLGAFPELAVMHEKERKGKVNAMNRAMKTIKTPLAVFTDANTLLNPEAIREIAGLFADNKTGCVTGEKRISASGPEKAVSAGEGLYWQYESWIKRLESETGSVMGAVGELFAVRTELYEEVPEDTLLDDFTISMSILKKGFRVRYAPNAWGTETASLNINEEIKRKTRIAAGGLQALTRMPDLLNPFRYGLTSWMYLSHKVLRWILVPSAFPLVFMLNMIILMLPHPEPIYIALFVLQAFFYLFVLAGAILHNVRVRFKVLIAPYYLFIMNYAMLKGTLLFLSGRYSVNWQKIKRS